MIAISSAAAFAIRRGRKTNPQHFPFNVEAHGFSLYLAGDDIHHGARSQPMFGYRPLRKGEEDEENGHPNDDDDELGVFVAADNFRDLFPGLAEGAGDSILV